MLGVVAILFGFSFVFGWDALVAPQNTMYGVLALVGYVICIVASLMNGMFMRQNGGALALYYFVFVGFVSVILVWYLTRCGTAFGWWW
jgi:Flp pilus assembly pilin Flp